MVKGKKNIILKVLVGSHAHGLANKDSDKDYRAVYVAPTSEILSLGYKYKGTDWCEGDEDNTAYEIGHFLHLATHCNPSILEVFKSPVIETTIEGEQLRNLFPYLINTTQAKNAFIGYSKNQEKKFLNNKDNRSAKFAVAYYRVLLMLEELLKTGDFDVKIKDFKTLVMLKAWKEGNFKIGNVVQKCHEKIEYLNKLHHTIRYTDLQTVNNFLLKIRKDNWDAN